MNKSHTQLGAGWRVRLDPDLLSPDPSIGVPVDSGASIEHYMDIHPWDLISCDPPQSAAEQWAQDLNGKSWPGALTLKPDAEGRIDLVIDFPIHGHAGNRRQSIKCKPES